MAYDLPLGVNTNSSPKVFCAEYGTGCEKAPKSTAPSIEITQEDVTKFVAIGTAVIAGLTAAVGFASGFAMKINGDFSQQYGTNPPLPDET